MKKERFVIKCRPHCPIAHATVEGYTFCLGGFRWGFTRQNYLGKDCGRWYSVELTTGYTAQQATFKTLKSAVLAMRDDLANERYRNFLRDFLKDCTDCNPGLTPRYTVWGVMTYGEVVQDLS